MSLIIIHNLTQLLNMQHRYCMRDQGAELVVGILRTLHACFEAVDLDDAVLRLPVSLKLALLLEEPAHQVCFCVCIVHVLD